MRLFGRFKKPQAPAQPVIIEPQELPGIDKLISEIDEEELNRYPSNATPQIGANLFTASLPVRQIPVVLADDKPVDFVPQVPSLDSFGPRDDSVSSYATLGLSDSELRQITLDVLTSKLRSQ